MRLMAFVVKINVRLGTVLKKGLGTIFKAPLRSSKKMDSCGAKFLLIGWLPAYITPRKKPEEKGKSIDAV